jgi:hypothetical protein
LSLSPYKQASKQGFQGAPLTYKVSPPEKRKKVEGKRKRRKKKEKHTHTLPHPKYTR